MSVAIVDADGDYGAVIVSGANLTLGPADVEAASAVLGGAKVLLLQNEVPEVANLAAAAAVRGGRRHGRAQRRAGPRPLAGDAWPWSTYWSSTPSRPSF